MADYTRQHELATGKVFSTRNPVIEGVTEILDRPATDRSGHPLPPKFPALRRVSRAPIEADEAATTEANQEATHDD